MRVSHAGKGTATGLRLPIGEAPGGDGLWASTLAFLAPGSSRARHGLDQRFLDRLKQIGFGAIFRSGIAAPKRGVLIARGKNERNLPGHKHVSARIGKRAAEIDIENRGVDV